MMLDGFYQTDMQSSHYLFCNTKIMHVYEQQEKVMGFDIKNKNIHSKIVK